MSATGAAVFDGAQMELLMSPISDQRPRSFCNVSPAPQVTMRRGAFLAMTAMLVAFAAGAAGSVGYILWRDEALRALSARHAGIERSYEAHVTDLRRELEKVNSQRVLAEAALASRVRELWARQAKIERRTTMLSALAGGPNNQTAVEQAPNAARTAPRGATALGYAPAAKAPAPAALEALEKAAPASDRAKAAPSARSHERPTLRGAFLPSPDRTTTERRSPVGNFASMVRALDRIEAMQVDLASAVGQNARREAGRLQALARHIGLSPDRLAKSPPPVAEGGPFVPLDLDPNGSPFDREILRHRDDVMRADSLRRLLAAAPLGRPVSRTVERTSGFGSRIDPFLGRLAYHTGVDFRETTGAPVFATGPGKVVAAGSNGGYGMMVEIDHGAGVSTRYAHLSAILVEAGQTVSVRETIGRVGSTGRSTGPHLHYEVRIDDDPVDPVRFLKAGERLAANSR